MLKFFSTSTIGVHSCFSSFCTVCSFVSIVNVYRIIGKNTHPFTNAQPKTKEYPPKKYFETKAILLNPNIKMLKKVVIVPSNNGNIL